MSEISLRRGDVIRLRDERWTVRRHVAHGGTAVVEVRGCDRGNRGIHARFLLPVEPVERLPPFHAARVVSFRRWRVLARQTLAEATPSCDSLRTLARSGIDLLPFQLEPALAIVRGAAARILIADEVGLGKTVQAGLIIAETLERCADAHVLVAVPAALREQWCEELRDRFHLSPVVLDSLALSRSGSAALSGANPWAAQPLIVTSVDYVKRPEAMRSLETLVWDLVVVDEAHGLSGRSDRNAALTLLGERARTLVMLTATPHSGDDSAFARMCGIGDLDDAFPLLVFRRTRLDAGLPSARTTKWLNVATSAAESALHGALTTYARLVWRQKGARSAAARLAMVVLMRRACSSPSSLARSVERRMSLLDLDAAAEHQLALPLGMPGSEDEEPGAELGAPGLANAKEERRCLDEILQLARNAAGDERKLHAVRRLVRRTGEPAIVFTEYRDTLVPLAAALAGITTAGLHGGLTAAERREVLERFRSGAVQVLLATDAASEGLNLQQRCRLVINLELPWTPTRLEQRVGRVDRIGQRRRVHALHLVAAGTSEQSTVARLLRRMERVDNVLGPIRTGITAEQEIARCAIGQEEPAAPDRGSAVPLPESLIVMDFRGAAVLEAERARVSRILAGSGNETTHRRGPFVATARSGTRRDYWAFHLEFTDADDEVLWEALIGLSLEAASGRPRRSADIRRHADDRRVPLTHAARLRADALQASVAAALHVPVELAALREEAILAAALSRHGRLASALLQRGLFDRRVERAAATQDAALRETLSHCRARLAKLARRRIPMTGSAAPAFGLVRR